MKATKFSAIAASFNKSIERDIATPPFPMQIINKNP